MLKPRTRFLMWRYLMFWAWAIYLLAGFVADSLLSQHLHNNWLHWLVEVATVSLSVLAGKRTQTWLLAKIDPTGARRRDIRESQQNSNATTLSRALREPAAPQNPYQR